MSASVASVQEAELYLQSVHTKTNSSSRHEQIRELVTLATNILATKSSMPYSISAKSDSVVNLLIQTSEHLQQEEDSLCARQAQNLNQANSPTGTTVLASGTLGVAQVTIDDPTKQYLNEPLNSSTEEIGDIEWEAMVAGDVKFEHVVGCAMAIDAIRESVVIPMLYPELFKRLNVKRSNGIMLYGPPGTGKSMIARATASEVQACFFNASCADLTSRWVGGSEKKLKSLFAAAVRCSPSIIFFDEVDSIACKREGDGSIADQRLTNQLLIELDKIFLAQQQVFVIAATNLPWQIDLAVMRRFPHTVYIELPDLSSRKHMFRSFFDTTVCSDEHVHELASISTNMSGSDIANIVNSVLFEPIRTLCKAEYFLVTTSREHAMPSADAAGTGDSVGIRKTCIAVATNSDITKYTMHEPTPVGDEHVRLLSTTLPQIVKEYGESSITMPVVDYNCIHAKVCSFRHTVSSEYLHQYVKFHSQRS